MFSWPKNEEKAEPELNRLNKFDTGWLSFLSHEIFSWHYIGKASNLCLHVAIMILIGVQLVLA